LSAITSFQQVLTAKLTVSKTKYTPKSMKTLRQKLAIVVEKKTKTQEKPNRRALVNM